MQEAINVIEHVLLADLLARIGGAEMRQPAITQRVTALTLGRGSVFRLEQTGLPFRLQRLVCPVIEIHWKILRTHHVHSMKARNTVCDKYRKSAARLGGRNTDYDVL